MNVVMRLCFGLLLGGICAASPSVAQNLPRGSYLGSCSGAHIEGDTLIAHCRTVNGFEERSALSDVNRCAGDIANDNGALRCTYGRGPVAGAPPPGVVRASERCDGLRRDEHELRDRVEHTWDPIERARLEGRLNELRMTADQCR
jgi:hypothetical protein